MVVLAEAFGASARGVGNAELLAQPFQADGTSAKDVRPPMRTQLSFNVQFRAESTVAFKTCSSAWV